jgi:hypothetical protein
MSAPQDYSIFQCDCAYALMNRKKLSWWAYHKTSFPVASRGHELKGPILRATNLNSILKGKSCHRRLWVGYGQGTSNNIFQTLQVGIHGSAHHSVHVLHGQYLSCTWQDKIFCSACNAISHQLWTCNLSGEELDYYLQTSFVCLQAAVFKLFELNFAPTSIL